MTVLHFESMRQNQDVIESVRKLHEQAMCGDVRSLCWMIEDGRGKHSAGICGQYRADPDRTVMVANKAIQNLYTYAARKRLDPATLSKVI